MDECAEVRELLDAAALEPGGIERLEAGDTAEAAMVAGHLAFCPPCAEELVRLRRAVAVLRATLASGPAPALRERTLAFVRATGVERGPEAGPAARAAAPAAGRRRPAMPAWLAAAAAIVVVGALGAGFLLHGLVGPVAPTTAPDAALARIATTQARVLAQVDAVEVALVDGAGTPRGILAIAPSLGEMVVTATGLAPAPAGSAYRCWAEVGSARVGLGTMHQEGDAAWWAGPVDLGGALAPGTRFGVSLGDAGGSADEPVLVGSN